MVSDFNEAYAGFRFLTHGIGSLVAAQVSPIDATEYVSQRKSECGFPVFQYPARGISIPRLECGFLFFRVSKRRSVPPEFS
jgi:hypothetical protein